jgi:hypothetical protein
MGWLVFTFLVFGAVVRGVVDAKKQNADARAFDEAFLGSCLVADEIAFIEYRADNLVLAKCVDGCIWGKVNTSLLDGRPTRGSGRISSFEVQKLVSVNGRFKSAHFGAREPKPVSARQLTFPTEELTLGDN